MLYSYLGVWEVGDDTVNGIDLERVDIQNRSSDAPELSRLRFNLTATVSVMPSRWRANVGRNELEVRALLSDLDQPDQEMLLPTRSESGAMSEMPESKSYRKS